MEAIWPLSEEQCSGANGFPYEGQHTIDPKHPGYILVLPGGDIKYFCDTDCLAKHYAMIADGVSINSL